MHWQCYRKEVFCSRQALFFWAMDHFWHYLDYTKALIVRCRSQPGAKAQDITAKTVVNFAVHYAAVRAYDREQV